MSEGYYKFYQSLGICPHCKKEKLYGDEKLCPECLAKMYVHNVKYRKNHIEECKKSVRNYNHKKYNENKANGICTRCGKRKVITGKTQCGVCLDWHKSYHNKTASNNKYNECKEKGICTRCKRNKAMENKTICLECSEKIKAYRLKSNGKIVPEIKIKWENNML